MSRKVFINLPVKDLAASIAFFKSLGFPHNPQFTDDTAACIVFTDDIYAMLLTHPKWNSFTDLPIVDAKKSLEVMTCLTCDSRDEVKSMIAKAQAADGTVPKPPMDLGFMYGHSFADLDGHLWEWVYMDMSQVPAQ